MNGKPFGNNFRLLALVLCLVILTTVSAIAKKKPKSISP